MKTKVRVEIRHSPKGCVDVVDGICAYLSTWPRCGLFRTKHGEGTVLMVSMSGLILRCKQCLEAEEASK